MVYGKMDDINKMGAFINSLIDDIREQVGTLTLDQMNQIEDIINDKWGAG